MWVGTGYWVLTVSAGDEGVDAAVERGERDGVAGGELGRRRRARGRARLRRNQPSPLTPHATVHT